MIHMLQSYKEHTYTVAKWESFRKANKELNLPHSQTFIKVFSSWNNAKEAANLIRLTKSKKPKHSKSELIDMLKIHGHHFTSTESWNKYAKEHSLPSSTIILRSLDEEDKETYLNRKKKGYSKARLKKLLVTSFPDTTPTANDWETFRKNKNEPLPSQSVFITKFGSWTNALRETYEGKSNRSERRSYNEEELVAFMKRYFPYHAPTYTEWTSMKKSTTDVILPSITPYINHFGSWSKALDYIYHSNATQKNDL